MILSNKWHAIRIGFTLPKCEDNGNCNNYLPPPPISYSKKFNLNLQNLLTNAWEHSRNLVSESDISGSATKEKITKNFPNIHLYITLNDTNNDDNNKKQGTNLCSWALALVIRKLYTIFNNLLLLFIYNIVLMIIHSSSWNLYLPQTWNKCLLVIDTACNPFVDLLKVKIKFCCFLKGEK